MDVTDRLLEHDSWPTGLDGRETTVRQMLDRPVWIREDRARNDSFVDALCDLRQSLTFGGVIAHGITYPAYRRQVIRGTA
jgi:hypothetical protein